MMTTMYTFWKQIFTDLLPSFLMAEPICYIFGGFVFLTIIMLFKRAIR